MKYKRRDGCVITVECPESIVLYNKNMRGVDLNDQVHRYYNIRTKAEKITSTSFHLY